MRIAIDMMGGDYAPKEAILGVLSFLQENDDCHIVAIGNKNLFEKELASVSDKITVVHTEEIIGMDEHPIKAMKEKPQSSMVVGFGMLAKGEVDAFTSAGNTGVMLVGAAHILKLTPGVLRPTIPTPVPQVAGDFAVMLDVGINADCKPENLNQFAILGSIYSKEIFGNEKPSIALLNIGEEEGKGNILAQTSYPLLKENSNIHFVGNIEGRDIIDNKADVIVTDGFTGNIVLKFAESLYDVIHEKANVKSDFLARFNHKLYAGVPVLGVTKPLIVGHGVSDAQSFKGMLALGKKMITTQMTEKIQTVFASL